MRRQKTWLIGLGLILYFVLGMLMACGGSQNNPGLTNPGTPPPTDSGSGNVTFKGAPLAGATVTLWITNSNAVVSTTTTDTNGDYTFSGLSTSGNVAAEYQIWVSKTGYGFYPVLRVPTPTPKSSVPTIQDSSSNRRPPACRCTSPSSISFRSLTHRSLEPTLSRMTGRTLRQISVRPANQ